MAPSSAPLSGRRGEAARNDPKILRAARQVFISDPEAPISAVARRAGVGMSALYRRYRSKDDLLKKLARDGLQDYVAEVEAALGETGSPWPSFEAFMRRALDAGTGSLTARFNAGFTTTKEMHQLARRASLLTRRLIDRAKQANVLRPDIEVGDISLLFEQLQSINLGSAERTQQVRQRYLALIMDGLHRSDSPPLPGPAPRWEEISGRYRPPTEGSARRQGPQTRRRPRPLGAEHLQKPAR